LHDKHLEEFEYDFRTVMVASFTVVTLTSLDKLEDAFIVDLDT
jgi:hypothetical protein